MQLLPLTDLDSLVRLYDQKFPSIGKQMWRTPNGRIIVTVNIGSESLRPDHKPHCASCSTRWAKLPAIPPHD